MNRIIQKELEERKGLESFCLPTIPLGQLRSVDMRQEIFSNRRRAGTDYTHLCECLSGNERLEEPEDPGEDGGDVDEKFLVLVKGIKCRCGV